MSVIIYSKDQCRYCELATQFLEHKGIEHEVKKLGVDFDREELLTLFPDARTFPVIDFDGTIHLGYDKLVESFNV